MPHSRTDIEQDDFALRCLSGCQFKILRALVNRADERGICYPSAEYLAGATGYNMRHVWRALQFLNDCDVIRYVRRDEFDHVTRRKLPNAYQVNPDYICLAVDFVAEAHALWDALIEKCGNRCLGLWSHINQQPTPVSQYQYPTPESQYQRTNTNNQHSRKANGRAADDATRPAGKDKNKNGGGPDDSETNNQREAHAPKSSVPAPRPKFANPDAIGTNLPDKFHEQLAFEIRAIGIAMPLARGFVMTYGYDRVKTALAATLEMGTDAKNPAGLFRSICQQNLADDFALSQQMLNNMIRRQ